VTLRRTALAVLVLVGLAAFALPVAAALARVEWDRAWEALRRPGTLTAARLSLVSATEAALAAAVLGTPLAWVLARRRLPGRAFVRAVVLMPILLPPTVAGAALLAAAGPDGILGDPLAALGVRLPGTLAATVIAEALVAAPFYVLAAETGLRGVDRRLEAAAASLGASGWFRFRTVTFRLARRQMAAGLALAWARALGEFGATVTFAGDVAGRTRTLPLEVSLALRRDPAAALATSVPLMLLALVVVLGAWRALFGADR
jgi:molybdate transport system permease protein